MGVGYNYNSSSNNDGITATTTKLNDLHIRLGVDKAYKISKRWTAGVGFDLVYNNNNDSTTATVNANFNGGGGNITTGNEVSTTQTTVSSFGGGPMAWLRFNISERILIGTETSFYYVTGNQTQTFNDNFAGSNGFNPVSPTTSNSVSQGNFSSPVAFFLHVKF